MQNRGILTEAQEIIADNWNLEKPTEIREDMSNTLIARFKMAEFGEDAEGKAKFKEWLKQLKDGYMKAEEEKKNILKFLLKRLIFIKKIWIEIMFLKLIQVLI